MGEESMRILENILSNKSVCEFSKKKIATFSSNNKGVF